MGEKEKFIDDYAYRVARENPKITSVDVNKAASSANYSIGDVKQGIGATYDPSTKTITTRGTAFSPEEAHELGGHHMRKELFGSMSGISDDNKAKLETAYPNFYVPLEEIQKARPTEERIATNTGIRAAIMRETGLSKQELDNYINNLSDAEILSLLHSKGNGYIIGSAVPFTRQRYRLSDNSEAKLDDWEVLKAKLPEGMTAEEFYGVSEEERQRLLKEYNDLYNSVLTEEDRKQAEALRYTLLNIARNDAQQGTSDWLQRIINKRRNISLV